MKKEMEDIIAILGQQPSVLFAYLFGSKAKGNANKRSDWDIAVYFEGPKKKGEDWPAFNLEAVLSRAVKGEVQVMSLNDSLPPLLGFEIVKDGINGYLVPAADSQALAKAVIELLQNPDKAKAMGDAGRKLANEKFTVEAMVRSYERLYVTLMEDVKGTPKGV